jgi:hypothetical protein
MTVVMEGGTTMMLILDIQDFVKGASTEGKFDDFKFFNDYANTREKFSTPVVQDLPNLQYIQGYNTEEEYHGMDIQNTELDIHFHVLQR